MITVNLYSKYQSKLTVDFKIKCITFQGYQNHIKFIMLKYKKKLINEIVNEN